MWSRLAGVKEDEKALTDPELTEAYARYSDMNPCNVRLLVFQDFVWELRELTDG